MPRSEEEKCAREIRTACMNVVGFYQLMQESDEHKVPSIKRMEYHAHVTFSVLKMADLIIRNHQLINRVFADTPVRAKELIATANKIKFLAIALNGQEANHFAREASLFAVQFLRTTKGRP